MNASTTSELQTHLQGNLHFIDKLLQETNPDLNDIDTRIKDFERLFSEKASFLPSYDVKKLQTSILSIKEKYQALYQATQPKKRFAFKSRVAVKTRQEIEAMRAKVSSHGERHEKAQVKATLRDRKGETLSIHQDEMDPLLTHLIDCTVHLAHSVPSTLHMTDLKNCFIVLGPVQTSVFIERCEGCTFYIYCQQLRMHDSRDCSVYLHVTSKGIIEGCKNVGFGPYLASFEKLSDLIDKSGLDQSTNHWKEIQDFNWLTPDQPSPNWFAIQEKDLKEASI